MTHDDLDLAEKISVLQLLRIQNHRANTSFSPNDRDKATSHLIEIKRAFKFAEITEDSIKDTVS